ncbi:MAG: hypothetical protein CMJ85_04200 [Planctomycetes bacterium]|nr:hypothetical protein [Planctomycetota bacterium]
MPAACTSVTPTNLDDPAEDAQRRRIRADRLEVGVGRFEHRPSAHEAQRLDRGLVVDEGSNDLAGLRGLLASHDHHVVV